MPKPKFDIMSSPGQVNQLLNQASKDLGGRGKKMTFLPREMLMPLPENTTVYTVSDLEATAKDMAAEGVRQPLIVFKNQSGKYYVLAGNRRLAASKLAIEKYGADLESLPCIIQQAPSENYELMKRLVKDNLQRVKSGSERMMEIVTYRQALKDEREANPDADLPTVRDALKEELGVTDTEITRYLKIYKSLCPALMEKFKSVCGEEATPMMTTDVAYRLAREAEDAQAHVAETYNWEEPLTNAKLTSVLDTFYGGGKDAEAEADSTAEERPAPENAEDKKPSKAIVSFTSVHEGTQRLAQACDVLTKTVAETTGKALDKKVEKRFLKRIAAEMAKIEALSAELQAFYDGAEDA